MSKIVKICLFLTMMLIVFSNSVNVYAVTRNDVNLPYNQVNTAVTYGKDASGVSISVNDIFQYILKGLAFVYILCTLFVLYELVTGNQNRIINNIIMVLSIAIVLVGKMFLMIVIPILLASKVNIKNRALRIIVDIILILCLIFTAYVLWTGVRPVFMSADMY